MAPLPVSLAPDPVIEAYQRDSATNAGGTESEGPAAATIGWRRRASSGPRTIGPRAWASRRSDGRLFFSAAAHAPVTPQFIAHVIRLVFQGS